MVIYRGCPMTHDLDGYCLNCGLGPRTIPPCQCGPPFPEASQAVGRRLRITWASSIAPEPVTWAWSDRGEGRIPAGSLSMATGREGTGKSSFGIWLTARITTGTLSGAFYHRPRPVFYVAVEDSWKYTLVPRFMAAGADLTMVGRFEVVTSEDDEVMLSLPSDNDLLEKSVAEYRIALVVVDPLMSVIGEKIDTHRERETRSALDPLVKIADRTGAVILGIAHFNKSSGSDAASLITGSGAFKNVPRSVFGFAREADDGETARVMTQVKNSLGRDDLPSLAYEIQSVEIPTAKGPAHTGKFVFTGESDRSVHDILASAKADPEERTERTEAADWLRDYLEARGTVPSADVKRDAKRENIAERTLQRARRSLTVAVATSGFPPRSTWTLPAGTTGPPFVPSVPPDARLAMDGMNGTNGGSVAQLVPLGVEAVTDDPDGDPDENYSQSRIEEAS